MTIVSIADYKNSLRERPVFQKTSARATVVGTWFTLWDGTGSPGAGALSVGNTANGLVPTDATTGAPTINFGSGVGYLTEVDYNCALGRYILYDRLFHAGAYAFNAATTLASQPSYSSRVPGGTDYTGLRLLFECVTTFTGNPNVVVTYTNQSGAAGHSSTLAFGSAPSIGTMYHFPLQAGDSGLQKVESVTATVATVGTFNIVVARPIWSVHRGGTTGWLALRHWMDRVGMPQVFGDSCLALMCNVDTNTPLIDLSLEIASK